MASKTKKKVKRKNFVTRDYAAVRPRLNKIIGQLKGAVRMSDSGRDCMEILNVLSAARAAINGAITILLEDHIRICLRDAAKEDSQEAEINELLKVLRKYAD